MVLYSCDCLAMDELCLHQALIAIFDINKMPMLTMSYVYSDSVEKRGESTSWSHFSSYEYVTLLLHG